MKKQSSTEKLFLGLLMLAGWFALIAQLVLIIQHRVLSVLQTLNNYISFFTILTNLLVAVTCTFLFFNASNRFAKFLTKPSSITATTIYILVVGAVYNLILRFLWNPKGMDMVVDEMLHTLIPSLFLIYWIVFVPKQKLSYVTVFSWMLYPLIYFAYIIVRGSLCDRYPYPFVNVTELGYPAVFINSTVLTAAFGLISLLFIAIGNGLAKKNA